MNERPMCPHPGLVKSFHPTCFFFFTFYLSNEQNILSSPHLSLAIRIHCTRKQLCGNCASCKGVLSTSELASPSLSVVGAVGTADATRWPLLLAMLADIATKMIDSS